MARVLIVGATSAIATAVARELAGRGDELLIAARNSERLATLAADLSVRGAKAVHTLEYDALAEQDQQAFSDAAWGAGLDLLLVAHGTLPEQEAVQDDPVLTAQALQVNSNSVMVLLSAFSGRFAEQGSGAIAVISSVAGDRGRQSNYVYGASKAALSTYCQGLRNRLAGRGVQVLTIKPGFVDTPMTADFPKGPLWAAPRDIAGGILAALDRGRDVVYLPWFWRYIMVVIRMLPEHIFKRLSL